MEGSDKKFDDLLSSLRTGKWNVYILFFVSLFFMHLPMFIFTSAFAVPNLPHTCIGATPEEQYHGAIIIAATSVLENVTLQDDKCSLTSGPGDSTKLCTNWAFNNTVYGRTLTSEFDLVCERDFLRGLFSSMYFFGSVSGSSMSGWMSDRFGRKRVFSLAVVWYGIIAAALSWMPYLTPLLALRFLLGFLQPFTIQPGYTLVMEVFEARWRSTAGIIVFLPWCFGLMVMAAVSYLVRDWRWQHFYLSLPVLVLLPFIWLFDESPRWLIVRGRHAEAHRILKKAARWNNTTLPPTKELVTLMNDIRHESADSSATEREGRWQKLWAFVEALTLLLRTRTIRSITLLICCNYFISAMGYVGLSLGGDHFSSNPFVYMAISGAVEIPGASLTIPVVERLGRRLSNVVLYFLTGACLLALTFTPARLGWVVMTLALLGKMTLTAAYQILFLQCGELFPTEVRSWGMANATMMAQMGSIAASFLVSALPSSWSSAVSIIIGCSCLFASWTTSLLPETRGAALFDTVAALEAEATRSMKRDEEKEKDLRERQQLTTTTTTTTT